jgi:hypothetical protein
MTNKVFALRASEPPWGDYGRILMHGMSSHLPRENGLIQLERTGPFVPPLSFPVVGVVIATQEARELLAASTFGDLRWNPVTKRHIVKLDWRSWNRAHPNPLVMPAQDEPEAYVLGQPHASDVAMAMPDLWELEAKRFGSGTQQRLGRGDYAITLVIDAEPPDFFRTSGLRHLFVSERAAEWLTRHFSEWIALRPVSLAS